MNWSTKDKNRASRLIERVAKATGGWQAAANALNLNNRQQVKQWHTAGRVPVPHCANFIALAAERGIPLTASDINPDARILATAAAVQKEIA